jgi:diguanylate cyclase (GGDEF)-like protein/putative nucleotidyltransferase with HDIG domain
MTIGTRVSLTIWSEAAICRFRGWNGGCKLIVDSTLDEARPPERKPIGPVLVVDDDPDLADILQTILRRHGYQCHVARDSEGAWQLLSPDVSLVLLDIMMPGENGPEVLRRMRLDPMLAQIPVIFVTARSDAATRIQCLAMGAQGFVVKPFRSAQLLATIRSVVGGQRADGDPETDLLDPLESALGLESDAGTPSGLELRNSAGMFDPDMVRGLLAERQATRLTLASHRRLVSALFRLHQLISGELPPERVAQGIVQLAAKVLNATRLVLWAGASEMLRPLAVSGVTGQSELMLDGSSLPARAWREWLTIEQEHAAAGEREMHVPLTVGTERVGVLSFTVKTTLRPSASLSVFFCAEAALALDAAMRLSRAQSEAITDPLTGLYNRRFLDQRLGEELALARGRQVPLSVLFLDIDRFKHFNDIYGHDRGDQMLKLTARAMRESLRGMDIAARYGGEEFVVVLPETDREGSFAAAQRVRSILARVGRGSVPGGEALTVTIGIATFPHDGEDAAGLVARADSAMLRGKRAGRDRVEVFGSGAKETPKPVLPTHTPVVIRTLITALRAKDPYTALHACAVGALSARLARHMDLGVDAIRAAGQAGLLHDIGKLQTPEQILLKPGPLNPAERLIMNQHAETGAILAAANRETRHLAEAVRASQEHFDGSGYPQGLAGEQIPLVARIISVADAFHAMCSDRPYRAAVSFERAAAELRRCAGTQFDPKVVEALIDMLEHAPPEAPALADKAPAAAASSGIASAA